MVNNFKVILFIVSLGSITLLWYYARLFFTTEPAELVNAIETNAIETKHSTGVAPTRFIYLTQTENCIPTYLSSPEVIGDSEACQCDVIILSYKTKCADTSLPHVQYIFNSNKSITWTTGRNLLYEAAKKRKEKYIHYIFIDDDVQLIPVDKKNTQNPFRRYEESLKIFQPAVVVILDGRKRNHFPTKILPERLDCELTRYVQIYRIDGLFIAYHYQAIDYILPYVSKYDSVSWWYSQEYTNVRLNIRFNGQVVTDPRFRTPNPQHRDYQKRLPLQDAFNNFVADIRLEEPEKYRKSFEPILQQWLANDDPKWMLGQQTCVRDLSVHPYRPYENLA